MLSHTKSDSSKTIVHLLVMLLHKNCTSQFKIMNSLRSKLNDIKNWKKCKVIQCCTHLNFLTTSNINLQHFSSLFISNIQSLWQESIVMPLDCWSIIILPARHSPECSFSSQTYLEYRINLNFQNNLRCC